MDPTITLDEYEALRTERRAFLGFEDVYGLQVWGGDGPTEVQVARVTAPPSHAEVLRALGPVARREVCRGGTVQVMSDDWESCRGCCGCAGVHTAGYRIAYGAQRDARGCDVAQAQFEACRAIGIFLWRVSHFNAHAALYRTVAGFDALAQIGRTIAHVAAIGYAVGGFVQGAIAAWNTVGKGRWYRVEGKRGKAKAHHGALGECVWLGESSYVQERPAGWRGAWRGRTSSTLRAGILPLGAEKTIYVPASSLTPIKDPVEGVARSEKRARAKAERGVRPNYYGRTGRKADVGYVVAGPHKGTLGQVFWSKISDVLGEDGRVGVKTSRDRDAEPMWIGARDVIGSAARYAEFAKFEVARYADGEPRANAARLDALLAGAYACVEALVDAGFDVAAEEWAAVTKQIEGAFAAAQLVSSVEEVPS